MFEFIRAKLLVVSVGLLGLASCGHSDGIPLADVSGEVTYCGRPVPAEVIFEPVADDGSLTGRPSQAISGVDGRYRLAFTDTEFGAMIGPHRVLVRILPFADSGEPESFQDATNAVKGVRLVREVRAGRNYFHFPLTP